MHRYFIIFCLFLSGVLFGQIQKFHPEDFVLSGQSIAQGDGCFQLTEARRWQGGSIWYKKKIDLQETFEIEIKVFLGCNDEGADGMVFILHPYLTTGFAGEGMGFGGLYPSFGVEMDTYRNYHLYDPGYDHASFMAHGYLSHEYGLTEPISLSSKSANLEDCRQHLVKFTWNPKMKRIRFFFDGELRIVKDIDLVKDLFEGNSQMYWGFTSATGNKYNTHKVCLERLVYSEPMALSNEVKELFISGEGYVIENLDFPTGSARIPSSSHGTLDKMVRFFNEHPQHSIIIDGFTDSSGDKTTNLRLSERRAKAIADYFLNKGLDPKRILYFGNGEDRPIAPNNTIEGRKLNRRIELKMKKLKV
jgi:outer membrane protein OmpA-like peptidoglycan-associated protein